MRSNRGSRGHYNKSGGPVYDSMQQCSAVTHVPLSILKRAKKSGCVAFESGSRVRLYPLLQWLFSRNDESTDWTNHYNKFHALIEEIAYGEEEEKVIDRALVIVCSKDSQKVMFNALRRMEKELPPLLVGRNEIEIHQIMKNFNDLIEQWIRSEYVRLGKG